MRSSDTTPTWEVGARKRAPFFLLTSILLALLASLLIFIYLERVRAESVPSEPVVIAVTDLHAHTDIDPGSVRLQFVPITMLPADHLSDLDDVVGRRLVDPIAANEVLLKRNLAGEKGSGLSTYLSDGERAMVLPAGWLVSPVPELIPGDRLDLVAYQSGQPVQEAGVIVEAVEVLGFDGTSESLNALTLRVDFTQAVAILYARSNGFSIMALLRSEEME